MRSALAIAIVLLFDAAQAQSYPSRPVRVVIGSPAASVIDVLARPIALRMSGTFGQQVIIDNRPGATGAIANELVARAQPDGHTLLASPNSFLVIIRVLGTPEIRELWASQGMEVVTNTPAQLAAKLREQHAFYGKLIRSAGIKAE